MIITSNTIRISINQLLIGMKSAETIVSSSGLVLVSKNTTISIVHLFRLKLYQVFSILVYSVPTNPTINLKPATPPLANLDNDIIYQRFSTNYNNALSQVKGSLHHPITFAHFSKLYITLNKIVDTLPDSKKFFHYLYHTPVLNPRDLIFTHSLNVSLICFLMGRWLNYPIQSHQELILAGLLHDIGKLDVSTDLLYKPGKLSEEEYELIKCHPLKGLEQIDFITNAYGIKMAILQHHERIDGSGYPFGFRDKQIHTMAKIVSIADIYDAITSYRSYHEKLYPFKAILLLQSECNDMLDSDLLSLFIYHLSTTYVGSTVLLSNGETGILTMINRNFPTRPLVQIGSKLYDLSCEESLEVLDVY